MGTTSVHLNITNKCNLRCKYCYFFDDEISLSKSEPTYEELIEYMDQAEEIGAKLIVISGGEALLHPDIFKLLNYGNTPKMLLTNGILLDEDNINKLNNIKTLKDIKISFDGFEGHDINRGKGTSEIVQSKLELVDRLGNFPYTINTVLTQCNYKELSEIYELILASKCYRWEVDFPLIRGRAKNIEQMTQEEDMYKNYIVPLVKRYIEDDFPFKLNMLGVLRWELLDLNECDINKFQTYAEQTHPCAYALDGFTIQTSGDISFCPSLPIVFGNTKESKLKDILSSKKYKDFSNINISEIGNCTQCRYLNLCGGGCRADAVAINNDILSTDQLSCQRMLYLEKFILNVLPENVSKKIKLLLNENGFIPNIEVLNYE